MGGQRNRLQLGKAVYFKRFFFIFFDPCGRDFMVSQIGPNAPYLLLTDHFEPIRDTIKSTVAARGVEKNLNARSKLCS